MAHPGRRTHENRVGLTNASKNEHWETRGSWPAVGCLALGSCAAWQDGTAERRAECAFCHKYPFRPQSPLFAGARPIHWSGRPACMKRPFEEVPQLHRGVNCALECPEPRAGSETLQLVDYKLSPAARAHGGKAAASSKTCGHCADCW